MAYGFDVSIKLITSYTIGYHIIRNKLHIRMLVLSAQPVLLSVTFRET